MPPLQRMHRPSRRPVAAGLLFLSAPLAAPLAAQGTEGPAEPARPNVVLIVADDLGYGELGCYGGSQAKTPRIDSLARDGVLFTSAYVSGPVCAPSRAGLMTGRYPSRFGYDGYSGPVSEQIEEDRGVPTDEVLLPARMKELGYRTAVIGKWHLGINEKYRPERRGADRFFGVLAGGHDYFRWEEPADGPHGGPVWRDGEQVRGDGYLTEAFTAEAIRFLEEAGDEPFFLYLAHFNVHTPVQVPDRYLPEDRSGPLGRGMVVGMVQALDDAVGALLDALDRLEVADRTLVVFLNDNGSPRQAENLPLTGTKGTLQEGGVRVPMLLRWPGRIRPGTTYDEPVLQLDLLPTLVAAAGGAPPPDRELDGTDLFPFLAGTAEGAPHEALYWRFTSRRAIRRGDLKLHLDADGQTRLFDLRTDPGEQRDLAGERPGAVEELRAELIAWEKGMGE